jgi:NAD-dependent dihydropyrimidine dehydrogenase PreA subunit
MVLRKIVKIDEDLCDGCAQCIPNCAEGALKIIDGKAKIVKEEYCDGLGACLGHCPQDAIAIIEREAPEFDEEAVHEYLKSAEPPEEITCKTCMSIPIVEDTSVRSNLSQWPVQLNLVPLEAPFYQGRELIVAADCVPVAYPSLNKELKDRSIVVGCPKFDDTRHYMDKLKEIFRRNEVRGVRVLRMEVPCCSVLNGVVKAAVKSSGKDIPVIESVVTVKGELR